MIRFLTCLLIAVPISMGNSYAAAVKDSLSLSSIEESDTFFVKFESDTISLQKPMTVSQIVYAEHKESPSAFDRIVLPIIMLVLGVLIDRLVQIFVDRHRIKQNGKRWKRELLSYIPIVSKQINEIESFIIEYCNKPERYDIPPLTTFQMLRGSIFESLSKEDLYSYLERKNDDVDVQERYNKILSFIATLDMAYAQLNDSFHRFCESAGKQIAKFNKAQFCYSKILYDVSDYVPSAMDKAAYNELSRLYTVAFGNHPDVNPLKLEESFITPSLKIFDRYDKQTFKDLTYELGKMRFCINGMKLEKNYIKNNLETITQEYNMCQEFLSVVKDYFPS